MLLITVRSSLGGGTRQDSGKPRSYCGHRPCTTKEKGLVAKLYVRPGTRWGGRTKFENSGNPGGSLEATRRAFNKRFLLDLAEDWQQHGREVFKRVRRESPASYLKVCAMLVPKEMK